MNHLNNLPNPSAPLYWANLIGQWIKQCSNGRTDKRHRFYMAGTMVLEDLRQNFARANRPISPTSQAELADGFIASQLLEICEHPIKLLEVQHCLRSIWATLHAEKLVADAGFIRFMDFLCQRTHERLLFCNWLSSWPKDLDGQLIDLKDRLLKSRQSAIALWPDSQTCADYWNAFDVLRVRIANHYRHEGIVALQKYTLNMSRKRFLRTAPLGDHQIMWQHTKRTQAIRAQRKALRTSAPNLKPKICLA